MLFEINYGHYWLMDKNVKSANICIEKEYLEKMIDRKNFIVENVTDGYWRNFKMQIVNDYQDIWVIKKSCK